jgi:pimeloyl-ACP methyl ester carboxylesterase
MRVWLRRFAYSIAALIIVPPATGAVYQQILLSSERRAHPMPGELIDVGGYKMHIYCTGPGGPAVILDSGLGDSYMSWRNVQPEIAKFVSVCSYDRAGMGYSEPSPRPRTSRVFAEELHELLHAARVAPPYILVGHSFGGFNARLFASRYRFETAGMVLVDSSHPDQPERMPANDLLGAIREAKFLQYGEPIGISRFLGYCDADAAVRAAECTFNNARENSAELENVLTSGRETAAAGNLGDLPLVVISRDTDKRNLDFPADLDNARNKVWAEMQEELSHLSTQGALVIAKGSGHAIQNDRPDIVIQAVHNVVDQARRKVAPWSGTRRCTAPTRWTASSWHEARSTWSRTRTRFCSRRVTQQWCKALIMPGAIAPMKRH